ncbi:MAG: helix-turn-helix domain-containing protein [Nitrospira sp.]|nr:helix-turn-helix domain-containing protein [Nitrospira sp.]
MKPLTLAEAAQFLRMSRSSLYQRRDIPRYRRPGSRVMLFDQDELEAWLRQGRIEGVSKGSDSALYSEAQRGQGKSQAPIMDIQAGRVYHRIARYR